MTYITHHHYYLEVARTHNSMDNVYTAGKVVLDWGATPRQQQYGYSSLMIVTLVSGGQFPREANNLRTWGAPDNLPKGVYDSTDEALAAAEEAGINTQYAIYV